MERRILEILKDLMAMKSLSYSEKELEPAEYYGEFFRKLPYFQKYPGYMGMYEIPGDPFGRKIPYGVLLGKKKDTVVLSGHFDVVSTEEYGNAESLAYTGGNRLEEALKKMELSQDAKKDLESGRWIWGRGSCDMKGGLAIHTALFEKYAEMAIDGELEGSIVLMPVPDEESYSAGMREGARLLRKLKEEYGLNYKLMIDPEPTALEMGKQTLSIGSVGKCMPVILVQGKKVHSSHFFEGLSALSIISDIYGKINGSVEFCDVFQNEMTMPPTWFNMRDMKEFYDVSIPHRASGYFTVFSLTSTPDRIMEKVKNISKDALVRQIEKIRETFEQYSETTRRQEEGAESKKECIKGDELKKECLKGEESSIRVMSFGELRDKLTEEKGQEFLGFYEGIYKKYCEEIGAGKISYPDATAGMMAKVLDFSNIQTPVVIIAFAPPFYLPYHSDKVKGKEGYGSKAYEYVAKISEEEYGQPIKKENYFMGISDLSYSGITSPFDYNRYVRNNPLWGELYNIDFEAVEETAIPSIIYGPIGKEYHQYTERVNKESLLRTVPQITEKLIEYMWNL